MFVFKSTFKLTQTIRLGISGCQRKLEDFVVREILVMNVVKDRTLRG